jgi:hypothetical protein
VGCYWNSERALAAKTEFGVLLVPLNEGAVASRIYFVFFAISYGIQGLMLALGLVYRRNELTLRWRRNGIRELLSRTGLVAGSILGNAYAVTNDLAKVYVQAGKGKQILVANLPNSIFVYAMVGSLTGVALGVLALRLIPALRVPGRP